MLIIDLEYQERQLYEKAKVIGELVALLNKQNEIDNHLKLVNQLQQALEAVAKSFNKQS